MNIVNYPQRKRLRLEGHDYSFFGAYFLTLCTFDRRCILGRFPVGDADHSVPQIELSSYGKTVEKYLQQIPGIDHFCIMPNHIHMILLITDDNGPQWSAAPTMARKSVSTRIRTFKTLVTKEIGHPIFQRSFYDHIIRNSKDYENAENYIFLNPANWINDKLYQKESCL